MTVLCDNCSPRKGCTADKNRTECKYYQPQTNEEWFNGLPTIEKAKVIVNLGREQRFPKDVEVEICEQWLKEEHIDA